MKIKRETYWEAPILATEYKTLPQKNSYVRLVLECVITEFNITMDELFSKSRMRPFVTARQITMYILCMRTKMGLSQIGKIFGKNHATAIHSRRNIQWFIQTRQDAGLTALQILKAVDERAVDNSVENKNKWEVNKLKNGLHL